MFSVVFPATIELLIRIPMLFVENSFQIPPPLAPFVPPCARLLVTVLWFRVTPAQGEYATAAG